MGKDGMRGRAQQGDDENDDSHQQESEYLPLTELLCVAGLRLTHQV
jgi:hypothetical protein